jgi:molybdate transport system substrate-binding protein
LVLAASDLQFALPEIATLYQQLMGNKPTLSFGSTGTFAQQIAQGAPADVFFAADESFLGDLDQKELLLGGTRQLYAIGRIVLTQAKGVTEMRSLEDLLRPEIKKVAIGNPEHAPYGRAAQQALQRTGLWERIQTKLVLGDNISQTFQFIQTGNADAGVVALSLALGVAGTSYSLVDLSLHEALRQQAAVIGRTKQPEAARAFLAFVNGAQGRPVMKRLGFTLPDEVVG